MEETEKSDPLNAEPPISTEKARALVVEALDGLFGAIKGLERASWREGYSSGWQGHSDWVKQEIQKVVSTVAAEAASSALAAKTSTTTSLPAMTVVAAPSGGAATTANERVLLCITKNPGLRGIQIVNDFARSPHPLLERTIRTALHRLKADEKIVNVDGRWYTPQAAPAGQRQLSMEDPMDPP